jgi:peptide/nickel transport system permease protein
MSVSELSATAATPPARQGPSAGVTILRFLRRNPKIIVGGFFILSLLLISWVGPYFIDVKDARPMSVMPDSPPSLDKPEVWLGSDAQGRSMIALVIAGIPLTLRIGLVAGAIGLAIGVVLGFVSGYVGGKTDLVIRTTADIMLTVPGLLVLIVIAASIRGLVSITTIGLVVASLAWMWPTRTIRAQVLSLRERPYVEMAKLNGMSSAGIIFKELIPNLLPFLGASFVGAVGSAVLAAIGLEALGLGPQQEPTLGMTIYWAIKYAAILNGLWWWWAVPVSAILILFVGLFLMAAGLDEIANPRLRKAHS